MLLPPIGSRLFCSAMLARSWQRGGRGGAQGSGAPAFDDRLRKADAALYAARRAGRKMVALFDPENTDVSPRTDG